MCKCANLLFMPDQGCECISGAVWVDGGIHAREWIAIATASYMLQQLVEVFRTNSTADCDALAIQAVDW